MNVLSSSVTYDGHGIMSRVVATIIVSLLTLVISLTSSKKEVMVLLLYFMAVALLIRYTLLPLKEQTLSLPCEPAALAECYGRRDSREFMMLFALWLGWMTQSILAYFAELTTPEVLEVLRSFLLVFVAAAAWVTTTAAAVSPETLHDDVSTVSPFTDGQQNHDKLRQELREALQKKQRFLLTLFWAFLLPPATGRYSLLHVSPIVSVLRVMLVFGAAVVSDMKKKRLSTAASHTTEEGEGDKRIACYHFVPTYVLTFGWALYTPPLFWLAFFLFGGLTIFQLSRSFSLAGGGGMSSLSTTATSNAVDSESAEAGGAGDEEQQQKRRRKSEKRKGEDGPVSRRMETVTPIGNSSGGGYEPAAYNKSEKSHRKRHARRLRERGVEYQQQQQQYHPPPPPPSFTSTYRYPPATTGNGFDVSAAAYAPSSSPPPPSYSNQPRNFPYTQEHAFMEQQQQQQQYSTVSSSFPAQSSNSSSLLLQQQQQQEEEEGRRNRAEALSGKGKEEEEAESEAKRNYNVPFATY
jgi:hypothetical protein